MGHDPSILVAIATYNEAENLPSLVEAIHEELPNAHILIVDDNSPDGTGRWCEEFAVSAPWFSCLHREGKLGLGSAIVSAIHWGRERQYQLLVTLDADWSHSPKCLPKLVAAAESSDVVVGSRYCPGGQVEGWSWRRRLASRVNNFLAHHLVGLPTRDSTGNLRVYSMNWLAQIDVEQLQSTGYSFLEEIFWHLDCAGAHFVEVPITFSTRREGTSKIGLREIGGKLATLSRLAWRRFCCL